MPRLFGGAAFFFAHASPPMTLRLVTAMAITVTGLFLYPVKSLRGLAVTSAAVDALGLVGDRRFLVVDDTGRFLTQRTHPRLAQIATALTTDALVLSASGTSPLQVPLAPSTPPRLRTVSVWKSDNLLADDCGPDTSAWLTSFLGTPAHLVRIGESFHRPILKPKYAHPGDIVSFADAFPFLILGEASLADLNARLAAAGAPPVPLDRFRTNILVSGSPAFAEDTWPRFRIGEIVFRSGGPCSRCIMTTTDQATGERRGPEPLRTLATYRRDADDPSDVNFGQNLLHETKSGVLCFGDTVELL